MRLLPPATPAHSSTDTSEAGNLSFLSSIFAAKDTRSALPLGIHRAGNHFSAEITPPFIFLQDLCHSSLFSNRQNEDS